MSDVVTTAKELPLTILVVDDDALNQRMMNLILKREGHVVESASNGVEAVEAVRSKLFDLVLMDLQMPMMDGIEASRRIRELENGQSRTYIVALTASYLPERGNELFQAGIDNYLAKPFEMAHLRNMLHRLERRGAEAAATASPATAPADPGGTETEPDLDIQAGIQRVGGNAAIYRDLLSDFVDELPEKLDRIWRNYRYGDVDGLGRAAHNLKGVSANLGALRLSKQAQSLEKQVTQGYTESVEALLQDLTSMVGRLREAAAQYLAAGN